MIGADGPRKPFIYQITEDSGRTAYFNSYLGEVLLGIVDDKLPIKGTFAWSLVDNFEWNSGLSSESGPSGWDVFDVIGQLGLVYSMLITPGE